jgi:hypothetical protein
MNFAKYKAARKDNFNKLQSKLADMASGKGSYAKPEGYWQPTVDKAKNGSAIIRFLPATNDEDLPYVQLYTHAFKGPGGWYIENCLSTLNKPDPAVEYGTKLWEAGNKDRVSGTPGNPGTKRKNNYHSNIYVVKDPGEPNNEGKVFKFQYGPKLFEFLNDAMNPTEADVEAWSPFDLYDGANFYMRIRQVAGYRNFGKSSWEPRGPLFDDDDKMEALFNSIPSLKDIVSADKFKSYADLKARLDKVLGKDGDNKVNNETVEDQDDAPWEEQKQVAKTRSTKTTVKEVEQPETEEDVDNLAFFEGLRDK